MKNKISIFWAMLVLVLLASNNSFGQCPYIEEVRLWDNSWNNPSGQSQNNYENYSDNCIPLFDTEFTQMNVTASQGNVYMAMYADLDGNGTFETQIFNFFDANGGTGVNPTSIVQAGTPIRVIVSANPITSGDAIPTCGEAEDYVICGEDCPFIEMVRLWDNSWTNPSGQSANNYEDYTSNCIPLYTVTPPQINVTASQGNVYMAIYADLDGNGTFEQVILNQLNANGGFGINLSALPPGTPIRVIVSANPITSGDAIPTCGEAEDYVICGEDCPFIEMVRLWDNSWTNPSGQSANNYEDYTGNCIPLYTVTPPQINVTASQGNVYMAIYADLDGNGTFEQVILNQLNANGGFGINLSALPPGTPIRVIVSANPITSSDAIPTCGEAEDYVICKEDCPFIEMVRLWDNSWTNPSGQSANNYEDYTGNCIPLYTVTPPQINVTASQGNVYMAIYADLDGNGTFEQVILNQLNANGGFGINLSALPPGTPIRVIVSANPITSGDAIPTCGEAEDYVICKEDCPFIEIVRLWDNSWTNPSGQSANNYEDYTSNCIPLYTVTPPQINVTASQGNVYMAIYADLDGNGTFEQVILNQLDASGGFGINLSMLPPGTPIRVIVSANPITSGDAIPTCGEAEDYVICGDTDPCADCFNFFGIEVLKSKGCHYELLMDYAASGNCGAISIVSETWNFGYPGGTGSGYYLTHSFPGNGVYTITATIVYTIVATGQTCTSVQTTTIAVNECNDCKCVHDGLIQTFSTGTNCALGFWLGGWGIDGCATLLPGYTWNFGDGTGAVTANNFTSHTYGASGTYAVTVSFNVQDNVTGAICTQTYALIVKVDCSEKGGKSMPLTDAESIDLFNVRVFPNPSDDFVTFTIHNVNESIDFVKNPQLIVFDPMGREVHRSDFNGDTQQTVDFREFGSGTYIYKIIQSEQMLNTGELIIN